ncbi:MAG TPA: bifunctional aspartate kinase/homoserine dehydrogenase I [Gemmatimonadales bacterium]|nr:bifunctional aspartate kinase/homoserine dehydrogenase I [Gemmatimonadales bacterium]
MPPRQRRAPEVHKFGGASLADSSAIRHALQILEGHAETPLIVVVSAMAGVTDALITLGQETAGGNERAADALSAQLRSRHEEVAQGVLPQGSHRKRFLNRAGDLFAELEALLRKFRRSGTLAPHSTDILVSYGERLSAQLFAAALQAAGRSGKYVDAVRVLRTDAIHGHAAPDLNRSDRAGRQVLAPLLARDIIPVVPGFIGAAPDGAITTLGRGGSDLTATVLARALNATRVCLWKDVPGLLTADPRVVADARVIHELHPREAAELAYYGAKVLHPRALIPLTGRPIPIHVRPFADPSAAGTEVSERVAPGRHPVRALSAAPGQALVTVTGNGMLGVPGIAARTFAALHAHNISVSLISQASSEHSICLSVPEALSKMAHESLLQEFHSEIQHGEIDGVEVSPGMATIAVVGLGMHGTPGVAAAVFSALAAAGISVVAIAQGSSELNISMVVPAEAAAEAQRRIHAAFQLSRIEGGAVVQPERMELVILGMGQIGRALAALLPQVKRPALALRVVAVVDRSGFIFDPQGISSERLEDIAGEKRQGRGLAELPGGQPASSLQAVEHVARYALARPVLVDLTADETGPVLERALIGGMDLVLANKRPLASRQSASELLWQTARARGRRILHEATVGAGLPIIDTYHKLVESGDRVEQIEGLLSGTLGFVLNELSADVPFSEAVRRAMEQGYTEPDPRDDLSGMDVARKALILARLLGYTGEISPKSVESLVPRWARSLKKEEFIQRLGELDRPWAARVAEARRSGAVLRYIARVTGDKVAVGVRAVPENSPFARVTGSDNQLVFTTARYKTNPLVITGPGAGAEVTAAGVLNDILRLAGA